MSELEATTMLIGMMRLLTDQFGPRVAGELVRVALHDAPSQMQSTISFHGIGVPAGRLFRDAVRGHVTLMAELDED